MVFFSILLCQQLAWRQKPWGKGHPDWQQRFQHCILPLSHDGTTATFPCSVVRYSTFCICNHKAQSFPENTLIFYTSLWQGSRLNPICMFCGILIPLPATSSYFQITVLLIFWTFSYIYIRFGHIHRQLPLTNSSWSPTPHFPSNFMSFYCRY